MKPNPWFRMYHEFATDPKVQMLCEADQRRFVMLLCFRCCNGDVTLHDDAIAFQLRVTPDEWAATKARLLSKNLIDDENKPVAWERRQYVSDRSNERVIRHREKKKQQPKRDCNVTVTAPDTDTEADTDTEGKSPLPPKKGATPFEALKAFEAYNATALRCGLPQAAKLTPDRQRKIIARLKDYGLDGWSQAMTNLERSSFLTGGGKDGWRANLEFVLQASSFGKLHDGGYGNGRHAAPPQGQPPKLEAWQVPTRPRQLTSDEMEQLAIAEYERENAQCQ